MSFAWQDIRYGWRALVGIALTGATIYVAASTRQRVTQRDIIEIVLGTYERCLGTQYGTNEAGAPVYYVNPPEFTRDWVTTNEAGAWATNTVTNAIGWRVDRAMLVTCDEKIKECVEHCADPDSVHDGATNIVMLTVTGLWAELGIGDGTNKFTREPAIGTNAATYGEYPWRIYKTDLEERYKVLEALKVFRGVRKESVNGVENYTHGYIHRADLNATWWSNVVDSTTVERAWSDSYAADLFGEPTTYEYSIDPDYVRLALTPPGYDYPEDAYRKMSYGEWQQLMEWEWNKMSYLPEGPPPYTPNPNGVILPTNEVGKGFGGYWAVSKAPWVGVPGGDIVAWSWWYQMRVGYATWRFVDSFHPQLTCSFELYVRPTLPIPSGGAQPDEWVSTFNERFAELQGASTGLWHKVDAEHFSSMGHEYEVVFGADEFPAMCDSGYLPDFPNAPTEGTNMYNNGSVGQVKGAYVLPEDYVFLRRWAFTYATNRYW